LFEVFEDIEAAIHRESGTESRMARPLRDIQRLTATPPTVMARRSAGHPGEACEKWKADMAPNLAHQWHVNWVARTPAGHDNYFSGHDSWG
jgi:hypothetical protein